MGAAERVCSVCVFPVLIDSEFFQGGRNMIQDIEKGRRSEKHLGYSHLWMWCEVIRICPVLRGLTREPFFFHPIYPWGTGQFMGRVWIASPTRCDSTPVS